MEDLSPIRREKKSAIWLSTAYLPCLDYFALAAGGGELVIEIHETYPRQTWRNRCRILTANGVFDLVVPVIRPGGGKTPTAEVRPDTEKPWQKQHWRTIHSAYSKAPYFLYYKDLVREPYFSGLPVLLTDWNMNLFRLISGELGMNHTIRYSDSFIKPLHKGCAGCGEDDGYRWDFRYAFSPKPHRNSGLKDFAWPVYTQVFQPEAGFVPNLSILDLLFNAGPDAGDYLQACASEIFAQFRAG